MMLRALGPLLVLALVACESSAPPPRPAEMPIDGEQAAAEPAPSGDAPSDGDTAAAPEGDNAAASPGNKHMETSGSGPVPPAASPGKSGPIISHKECSELSDKGIELMAFGDGGPLKGHSGKQMEKELGMLKQMASNDPNFAKMKAECQRTIHRSQYDCGMKARSADEWQNCLR